MKRFLLLSLLSLFTACASTQETITYPYKPLSQPDTLAFMESGYQLLPTTRFSDSPLLINANFDKDFDNEVLLIQTKDVDNELVDAGGLIFTILDFNQYSGEWEKLYERKVSSYGKILPKYKKFDVNKDGVDEVLLNPYYIGGNDTFGKVYILSIVNNQIVDLMPTETVVSGRPNNVLYSDGSVYITDFIWESGRFGCNPYWVKEYTFSSGRFSLTNEATSSTKYALDIGDAQGQCELYPGIESIIKNEPNLFIKK